LSLSFINEIDKKGNNTFCVFTKIDLCDKSLLESLKAKITLIEKANEKEKHLDRKDSVDHNNSITNPYNGYIFLKNRSENQIVSNENLFSHLRREKDYYRSIIQLRSLSLNDYFGYDCLVDKFKKQLYKIKSQGFPKIYEETKNKISDYQDEIQKFGTDYIYLQNDLISSKISYLNTILSNFCDEIDCKFSGKLTKGKLNNENLTNSSLKKMYYEFLEDFKNNQSANLPSKSMSNEEIIHIIKVNEGDGLSGFPQAEVIHLVLEKELIKLRNKVKEFTDNVINIIISSVKIGIDSQFCRFPPLLERVEEIINSFLDTVIIFLFSNLFFKYDIILCLFKEF